MDQRIVIPQETQNYIDQKLNNFDKKLEEMKECFKQLPGDVRKALSDPDPVAMRQEISFPDDTKKIVEKICLTWSDFNQMPSRITQKFFLLACSLFCMAKVVNWALHIATIESGTEDSLKPIKENIKSKSGALHALLACSGICAGIKLFS